jgi:hypothetical protein
MCVSLVVGVAHAVQHVEEVHAIAPYRQDRLKPNEQLAGINGIVIRKEAVELELERIQKALEGLSELFELGALFYMIRIWGVDERTVLDTLLDGFSHINDNMMDRIEIEMGNHPIRDLSAFCDNHLIVERVNILGNDHAGDRQFNRDLSRVHMFPPKRPIDTEF